MILAKVRLAMASMRQSETKVGELCKELGITRQPLYRHVSPTGEPRLDGKGSRYWRIKLRADSLNQLRPE